MFEARHRGRADTPRSTRRPAPTSTRPKTALRQYIRAGGGFVGIHNAFGTEYNWPWYEGLLRQRQLLRPRRATRTAWSNIVAGSDSSTDGLPQPWRFQDEWYNLVPFPTRVKFLATSTRPRWPRGRDIHPGHGDFHPVAWCQYYDGGRSLSPRSAMTRCLHRRLGLSRASAVQAAHRQRHHVRHGQAALLHGPWSRPGVNDGDARRIGKDPDMDRAWTCRAFLLLRRRRPSPFQRASRHRRFQWPVAVWRAKCGEWFRTVDLRRDFPGNP